MRGFFEKKPLKLPKNFQTYFLYRAYRSFSTDGIVPTTGPQLPTRGRFVFREDQGPPLPRLQRDGCQQPCRDRPPGLSETRRFSSPFGGGFMVSISEGPRPSPTEVAARRLYTTSVGGGASTPRDAALFLTVRRCVCVLFYGGGALDDPKTETEVAPPSRIGSFWRDMGTFFAKNPPQSPVSAIFFAKALDLYFYIYYN